MTLALGGDEWSASFPDCFTTRVRALFLTKEMGRVVSEDHFNPEEGSSMFL
jgi:hypothetical protein